MPAGPPGECPFPLTLLMSQDGFENDPDQPIGRRAAGASFLKAYLNYSGNQTHYLVLPNKPGGDYFKQEALAVNPHATVQATGFLHWARSARATGTLHIPHPRLASWAWKRMPVGDGMCSLLGIVHTLCTSNVQRDLTELSTAPVRPWDALICTSTAGRSVVEGFLDRQEDYLRWRHGATKFERPQLPVIPLGIDPDLWIPKQDLDPHDVKRQARHNLNLSQQASLVLLAGRLDFMTKFQPDPLFRVLEQLRRGHHTNLELVVYGEAPSNDHLERWKRCAVQLAPSVPIHWIPGRRADVSATVRWAADVFVSLPDNPQETFGITPLEAMASGLACVVSDWDGYRDTVVGPGEGEEPTGLRIPTRLQQGLGTAEALAGLNESLDDRMAQGLVAQGIAVDPVVLHRSLDQLLRSPELRDAMGAAGRRRVLRLYDWKIVIESWRGLISELNQRRQHATVQGLTRPAQLPPWKPNTSTAFGSYATEVVDGEWNPSPPDERDEHLHWDNPCQNWDQQLLGINGPRRRGWWLKQGLVQR